MKPLQPELLAVRAVNQYRRRDVVLYLGLRLYLANRCARRDRWAADAACHLFSSRSSPCYFHTLSFKEHRPGHAIEHRDLHLPGPNEALVEAVLLQECARHPEAFRPLDSVFSYRLATEENCEGLFETYFAGFRERHDAIAAACRSSPSVQVLYTDIKRFYPTISSDLARNAWCKACHTAEVHEDFHCLGEEILAQHKAVNAPRCAGVLTGPMFSHLIANLVLREIDNQMVKLIPGRYFRYVDDIVIVGDDARNAEARSRLSELLSSIGLALHDGGKDFSVAAQDWLKGADDLKEAGQAPTWKSLAGDLKRFLLLKPDQRLSLVNALSDEEMRLPLPDYSGAVFERGYLERFRELAQRKWFRSKVRDLTITGVVLAAAQVRDSCKSRLLQNLQGLADRTGYDRKRRIPKLRYDAGRLLYLGRQRDLAEIAPILCSIPETALIGRVLEAVYLRDASALVSMGSNAVQSAAQVLRLNPSPVRCRPEEWGLAESQGLAILHFNGVPIDCADNPHLPTDELNQLATWDGTGMTLMRSDNPFIRELACLHGLDNGRRFDAVLDSAFDVKEALAFDAISQLNQSSSGVGV